jgi:hypothetical protein
VPYNVPIPIEERFHFTEQRVAERLREHMDANARRMEEMWNVRNAQAELQQVVLNGDARRVIRPLGQFHRAYAAFVQGAASKAAAPVDITQDEVEFDV